MNLLGERGLLRPLGSAAMVETMRNSVRDTASDLVMTAMNFLGVPYRLGGNSEQSGFGQLVLEPIEGTLVTFDKAALPEI
jgi:cell wall-associated NlpC family hydrolase